MKPQEREALRSTLWARRDTLADAWYEAYLRYRPAFVPRSNREIRQHLLELMGQVIDLLLAEAIDRQAIQEFGKTLARHRYIQIDSVSADRERLTRQLMEGLSRDQLLFLHPRLTTLLVEMTIGAYQQTRQEILADQEEIRTAYLLERRRVEQILHESQELMQALLNAPGDSAALIDPEGKILSANEVVAQRMVMAADELAGHYIQDFMTPAVAHARMSQLRTVVCTGKPLRYEDENDGRHYRHSIYPVFDEEGNVTRVAYYVRDITDQKRQEEEIRRRNAELSALNRIAATVNCSLDIDRIVTSALDEILRLDILGREPRGMIYLIDQHSNRISLVANRGIEDNHPCLSNPVQASDCLCRMAIERGRVTISGNGLGDERSTRRWPGLSSFQALCLPLRIRGEILGVTYLELDPDTRLAQRDVDLLSAIADQISVAIENARLYEETRERGERLHALTARLAEVEEIERERLSIELHDQVGQTLTAINLNLHVVQKYLSGQSDQMPKAVGSCLEESVRLVQRTAERIRDVMYELRPPLLDDHGLVEALRWYADKLSPALGVPIRVLGSDLRPPLDKAAETALYRIAQEALTNVARHALASSVAVEVVDNGDVVRMVIRDDGVGFELDKATRHEYGQRPTWGLITMTERAGTVGGRVQIDSTPGSGTQVVVEVPR
jgi:PAS domain S-box-containing protein